MQHEATKIQKNTLQISSKSADVLLLLVAVIWGGGFIAGEVGLETASPLWILFFRFGVAALCMGCLFFRQIRKTDKQTIRRGALLGVLQLTALFIQLFALQYTTTAKQSFLAATYVLFTPFIARLMLHKKILPQNYIASVLALAGIAFLSLRGSEEIQIGDFITLGFALIFSIQIVLIGQYSQTSEVIPLTFYQLLSSAVLAGIAAFCTGLPAEAISMRSWMGILYLGVVNTAVAFGVQNFAQKYTSESHAALLLSLESVFGLLLSIWFYDAAVTIWMGIGCALIFAALLVSNRR